MKATVQKTSETRPRFFTVHTVEWTRFHVHLVLDAARAWKGTLWAMVQR